VHCAIVVYHIAPEVARQSWWDIVRSLWLCTKQIATYCILKLCHLWYVWSR